MRALRGGASCIPAQDVKAQSDLRKRPRRSGGTSASASGEVPAWGVLGAAVQASAEDVLSRELDAG